MPGILLGMGKDEGIIFSAFMAPGFRGPTSPSCDIEVPGSVHTRAGTQAHV